MLYLSPENRPDCQRGLGPGSGLCAQKGCPLGRWARRHPPPWGGAPPPAGIPSLRLGRTWWPLCLLTVARRVAGTARTREPAQ